MKFKFDEQDWLSARRRYENDLRLRRKGIDSGELTPPEDMPLPGKAKRVTPAPTSALPEPSGVADPRPPPSDHPKT